MSCWLAVRLSFSFRVRVSRLLHGQRRHLYKRSDLTCRHVCVAAPIPVGRSTEADDRQLRWSAAPAAALPSRWSPHRNTAIIIHLQYPRLMIMIASWRFRTSSFQTEVQCRHGFVIRAQLARFGTYQCSLLHLMASGDSVTR